MIILAIHSAKKSFTIQITFLSYAIMKQENPVTTWELLYTYALNRFTPSPAPQFITLSLRYVCLLKSNYEKLKNFVIIGNFVVIPNGNVDKVVCCKFCLIGTKWFTYLLIFSWFWPKYHVACLFINHVLKKKLRICLCKIWKILKLVV